MSKSGGTSKIAILGAGQMAEALVGGLLASEISKPADLWATDPVAARRETVKARFAIQLGADNRAAADWADVIVLAVKPQVVTPVLAEVESQAAGKLVLSMAAGIPTERIRGCLPRARGIVRAMPNTPAMVHAGITALACGADCRADDLALARRLFEAVGRVVEVEERLMDAVTGLSGSGPAYVFVAIEAMADGGVEMGLPRRTAEVLAAQTVLGAARLLLERGVHPAQLKDQVASPGGTTMAGLHQLEVGGFRAALMAAVEAATRRSEELGRTCLS